MLGLKAFCSLVIVLSAIAGMVATVEGSRHETYGLLTIALAVVFSGALVGRCLLERGPREGGDGGSA